MHYWPCYSQISPAHRAGYLDWLAGARKDPEAHIGYVFLFFYGLERRLLADTKDSAGPTAEDSSIISEVQRLLDIYGGHSSFDSYAGEFLWAVGLDRAPQELQATPPSGRPSTMAEFMRLRCGLAMLARDGLPVTPEWAYPWLLSDPDTQLRTPARRCEALFRELFSVRYFQRFKDGLSLSSKGKKLEFEYRPASASFDRSVRISSVDLFDVASLRGPVRMLRDLAEACTDELEPYSRSLGRKDQDELALTAMALLPKELLSRSQDQSLTELCAHVERHLGGPDIAPMTADGLIARWQPGGEGKLTKAASVSIAQLLSKRGLGMEPDVRFGGPVLSWDSVVQVFRLPDAAPEAPTEHYTAAQLLVHLAASVSAADGTITEAEESHLEAHLERVLKLDQAERLRLRAHLKWLLETKPGLTGLKKRIARLAPEQRDAIVGFLVGVAGADGFLAPGEITTLAKIYNLLELDPGRLYSDLHAFAAEESQIETGPVTVLPPESGASGYPIPSKPEPSVAMASGVTLNKEKVEARLAQTAAVSVLLGNVFSEEPSAPTPSLPTQGETLAGLDPTHSALLRALAREPSLPRSRLEALAQEMSLMPDGALDRINEAAFELAGEALCEGDDPVHINPEVLKEMTT